MPIQTLENFERQDLLVTRGDSFFKEYWLSECEDNIVLPLDFSGYTLSAQIRQTATSRILVTPTVALVDVTNCEINLRMTTVQTLSLRPGQYIWMLLATAVVAPADYTHTILSGIVEVQERQPLVSDSEFGCSRGCP